MAPVSREADATTTDALKSLHQILNDTGSGFTKAEEEADEPKLRELFGAIASVRQKARDDIAGLLRSQGEHASIDGSFLETVHRTVIDVRSTIKGIDRDASPAFVNGKFEEALTEQQSQPDALKVIEEHLQIAIEQIDAMKRESDD